MEGSQWGTVGMGWLCWCQMDKVEQLDRVQGILWLMLDKEGKETVQDMEG